jgi:hypothetical protein
LFSLFFYQHVLNPCDHKDSLSLVVGVVVAVPVCFLWVFSEFWVVGLGIVNWID